MWGNMSFHFAEVCCTCRNRCVVTVWWPDVNYQHLKFASETSFSENIAPVWVFVFSFQWKQMFCSCVDRLFSWFLHAPQSYIMWQTSLSALNKVYECWAFSSGLQGWMVTTHKECRVVRSAMESLPLQNFWDWENFLFLNTEPKDSWVKPQRTIRNTYKYLQKSVAMKIELLLFPDCLVFLSSAFK